MIKSESVNQFFKDFLIVAIALCFGAVGLMNNAFHQIAFLVIGISLSGYFFSLFRRIDKLYFLAVILAPLSVSFVIGGGINLKTPVELILLSVLALFFVKSLYGLNSIAINWKHPINLFLLIDLSWMFVTTIFSEINHVSFKRWLMKCIFVLGYFIIFQKFVRHKPERLYKFYGLGLLIPVLIILIKHSQYQFNQATSFIMCHPFFDDHTLYGACLAFIIPYYLIFRRNEKGNWNYFNLILLVVLLFCLVTSYSRAAWISLIAAFAFWIILKLRIRFYLLAFGLGVSSLFLVLNFENYYQELRSTEVKYADDVSQHLTSVTNLQNDPSNLERINRWVCAYRMFEDRPIVGFGPGTYQFVYDNYQTKEFMTRISTHKGDRGNAHSEYMTYLSEQGIIGFCIYMIFVLIVVKKGMDLYYRNTDNKKVILTALLGLITFFVHGLFNTFSDISEMAILIYGSYAILIICNESESQISE